MQHIKDQITTCVSNKTQQDSLINFITSSIDGQKNSKLFVLYGTGGNGKSTLLDKIQTFLTDATGFFPLGTLSRQTSVYSSPAMYFVKNKRLVILHELENNEKLDGTVMKTLLYDTTFTGRLLHKMPELIENNANYIICTNTLTILDNLKNDTYEVITFDKKFIP